MPRDEKPTQQLPWRQLSRQERALLVAILDQPYPESRDLLTQLAATAAQQGCNCGCGTINLRVDAATSPVVLSSSAAPGEAEVLSEDGDPEGGLIVFVRDGYLSCLEVYSYGEPLSLPAVDRIRPHIVAGRSGPPSRPEHRQVGVAPTRKSGRAPVWNRLGSDDGHIDGEVTE